MRTIFTRPAGWAAFGSLSRRPALVVLVATVIAGLLCLSMAGPADADDDDDDGGEYVPRQIVVKLKPGTGIGYINNKYRTRTLEALPGGGRIYLLLAPRGSNAASLANRIQRVESNRVFYAEPNFRAGSPEASKRHYGRPGGSPEPLSDSAPYRAQYAVDNLNLDEAHQIDRGAGTVVAVIDTGVQPNHPELAGNTVAGYDYIDDDTLPNDVGNRKDDDRDGERDELVGHGTHVAGIVALAAPEAKIMPVRALDSEGRGTTFGIAKAIRFAKRNGADVVNLSLGSASQTDLLADLIGVDDDDDVGRTVFVAAAGNDNNAVRQFPAAEESAIAVTAVNGAKAKSAFANYGGWVKIAAPGTDIHSPFPKSRFATWSGTSMATPFVAGQAALVRGARPAADAGCVAGIIEATAEQIADGRLGSGHADVAASTGYAADPSNRCVGSGDD